MNSGCKVLSYVITTVLLVLYCIVLYKGCTTTQQNKILPFMLSLTPIKLMHVLLTIPFLYLTHHAVTNVRYSVNYKHHKSATDKYIPYDSNTIGQFSNITSISITCRLPALTPIRS